jgi:hypothetical protein
MQQAARLQWAAGAFSGVQLRLCATRAAAAAGPRPLALRGRVQWRPLAPIAAADPNTEADTDARPAPANGNGAAAPEGGPVAAARAASGAAASTSASASSSLQEEEGFSWSSFWSGPLPGKLAGLLGLIVLSRVGVYVRLPGVDVDAFGETMAGNGLLGYVDALSGGSISKVGLFSLGIIPYINASIVLQLFSAAFPSLKKMQREDGPQGRARFQYLQK